MILRETMRIGIELALRDMDHEKLVQAAISVTLDYLECLMALHDAGSESVTAREAYQAFLSRSLKPSPLAGLDPLASP